MPKATPTNPLILYYSGDVPSMKNEHEIHYHDGKPTSIGRSANVKKFLANAGQIFERQRDIQKFELIKRPTMVGAFVHLGVFISPKNKDGLPSQDIDNQYTSIQETWQNTVLENDVQVVNYTVARFPVFAPELEFALVFVWELENEKAKTDRHYVFDSMVDFYQNFYRPKTTIEMIGMVK